jgi:hypothetical protein
MTTNNAANMLNFTSTGVLGNLRVDKQTASNSAQLEFTGLNSAIEQYTFVFDAILPASAAPFYMLWSDAGGYLVNYAYIRTAVQPSGTVQDGANNQNQMVLTNIDSCQVFYPFGIMGFATLQGHASSTGFSRSNWNINYLGTSSANTNLIMSQGWGYNGANAPNNPITKVKFVFDSANIASGSITCYGLVS